MRILILFLLLLVPTILQAATYLDFEEFPVTTGSIPGDSTNWEYSSSVTNNYPANGESSTSGWKAKTNTSDGTHWFYNVKFNSCYDHIGVDTYGYLKITDQGHSGNALSYTVTGGKVAEGSDDGSCVSHGTALFNLESYTGIGDIYTGGVIGHPYMYFKKLNSGLTARDTSPYSVASGANRFSMYVWRPAGIVNGSGGYGNSVNQTFQMGLFRDSGSTGYHHYFNFLTQGGGWTKIQIEETTNGDNGGDGSTRYIDGLLETVWQWYWTALPYSGGLTPPYEYRIDDIEFTNDSYTPQNNETISNIALLYKDSDSTWEISFNDKYKNQAYTHATYELRYSLTAPITNENWSGATPAIIIADSRFYIQSRTDGKFQKWWPYAQGVWAPFELTAEDTGSLADGVTVYFAVKDISQNPLDLTDPVDGINTYWTTNQGGRAYSTYPAVFDYSEDSAALPYIKRISYTLAGASDPDPVNGSCGTASGQSFPSAPSTNLCATGTPTAVFGTGPWTWGCNGSNGGTSTASDACSASLTVTEAVARVNGRINGSLR